MNGRTSQVESEVTNARWMKVVLALAAAYNLVWGAWVIAFPMMAFDLAGLKQPVYPQIWQCVGMIVGCYGIGYAIAATDPLRWWPLVLVGLLGKLFGPAGFVFAAMEGTLPWRFGWIILTNDLIWWWPFGVIVYRALLSRGIEGVRTGGADPAVNT